LQKDFALKFTVIEQAEERFRVDANWPTKSAGGPKGLFERFSHDEKSNSPRCSRGSDL